MMQMNKKDLVGMSAAEFEELCGYPFERIRATVQYITPQIAAEWLAGTKIGNRNRRKRRIEGIARDVAVGAWKFTGAPILFDEKRNILDGQHRLTGCVKAGVPFLSMVIEGIEAKDALHNIDDVGPRSLADRLVIIYGVENANQTASICTLIWQYMRVGKSKSWSSPTFSEVEAVWKKYRKDIEWVMGAIGGRIEPGTTSGNSPILSAFVFARAVNPEKIEELAHAFKSSECGPNPNHPMRKLRIVVADIGNKNHQRHTRWHLSVQALSLVELGLLGKMPRRMPAVGDEVVSRILKMLSDAKRGLG